MNYFVDDFVDHVLNHFVDHDVDHVASHFVDYVMYHVVCVVVHHVVDHVVCAEVASKTEDTRLLPITLSVSLRNCYRDVSRNIRSLCPIPTGTFGGANKHQSSSPGQNFCIIINCSRKLTIWQKPAHILNFSRCFLNKLII